MKVLSEPRFAAVVVIPPVSNPFQCRDTYDDVKQSLENASLMNKGWEFVNQGGQRIYVPPWSLERVHIIYEAQVMETVPANQQRQGQDQRSISLQ